MECEVRVVSGMESCFVSLPLHLINSLESTFSGLLPPFLALELSSRNGDHLWHVAWSGSASVSPFIEIAQQFADCIYLQNNTIVLARAVPNIPKATLVTIEPLTEDDWEVLELNSEYAEAAILKQVGILHEAMRFPLWLHGKTIVTFLVTSIFPKKPVVQLVPGAEVAVSPKRREKNANIYKNSSLKSSNKERFISKVLLRTQDLEDKYIYQCEVNGLEMGVVLSSAVFVHPETAKNLAYEPLQLVDVVPKLSKRQSDKHSAASKVNDGILSDKQDTRQAIVCLLVSESVAKGHVMISQSLRLYLRADLHSWVYMQRCNFNLKQEAPVFSLFPGKFRMFDKNDVSEINSLKVLDRSDNHKTQNVLFETNSETDIADWSVHEKLLATLSIERDATGDADSLIKSSSKKGILIMLRLWFLAQLNVISSNAGVGVNSLVLGTKTILHFKIKNPRFFKNGMENSVNDSLRFQGGGADLSTDIMFILSATEILTEKVDAYELAFGELNWESTVPKNLELLSEKLQFADGVYFFTDKESRSDKKFDATVSSLSWMGTAASDVANRLIVLLSPASEMFFSAYDLPFPGHILIHGPSGSGKTLLARTVAKHVEEDQEIVAHTVFVSCTKLSLEKPSTIRQAISNYISEALDHVPSVVIFDDLDSIISSSSDLDGSQFSSSVMALTHFLVDIMDEYKLKQRSSCGMGPIAFIATVLSVTSIPQILSSSGMFDFHVQLCAPTAAERGALLKHEIKKRCLECSEDILQDIASKCDGYDAYDLEILVDRSVHASIGRHLSLLECGKPGLVREDFLQAMKDFTPVSMRDITKSAPDNCSSGWEDVGGLSDIKNVIKEMIELPSKFPSIFAQAPLRLRSNVLLYGPPGCGKTHIVGAAAASCGLRFISVKGPELLNKYIGASEQAVRDIFSKASTAAPCLLFFDEFDSIAPKRGHDNTGVTDRVVNQFLTELDGVEVLTGVFVFAATSRPDLLDAALLRPGRLDRLLFCDFPSQVERLDILTVLSKKLPLVGEVDLEAIAHMTEGFSGADLQALFSDAQLAAVHNVLDSEDDNKTVKKPVITDDMLKAIASKARPSVSETEKNRLYGIYRQFFNSKRSVAAQSKDAKGKRATLA